jgi:hypothetical protein
MEQYSLSQRFQGALLGCTMGQQNITPIDLTPSINWLCYQQQPPTLGSDPIENAIALLPLWLYTHESWRQRHNQLELLPHWQSATTNQSPLWLYGEAIAQLLRPTSDPIHLLPSIQTRWQQHANHGAPALTQPWHNCLTQIHQWQQQRTPLHQIQTDLTHYPATPRAIATALICFVRSTDDWSIALRLATQLTGGEPHIGGLLGGLWGAYNGWTRLPIAAISPLIDRSDPIPFTSITQQLIQSWSGCISTNSIAPRPPTIVLGPRSINPAPPSSSFQPKSV